MVFLLFVCLDRVIAEDRRGNKLEFHVIVSNLIWIPEVEPGSSGGAVGALTPRDICYSLFIFIILNFTDFTVKGHTVFLLQYASALALVL